MLANTQYGHTSICTQRATQMKYPRKFLDYITSDEYGKKMESLGYGRILSKMTVKEH